LAESQFYNLIFDYGHWNPKNCANRKLEDPEMEWPRTDFVAGSWREVDGAELEMSYTEGNPNDNIDELLDFRWKGGMVFLQIRPSKTFSYITAVSADSTLTSLDNITVCYGENIINIIREGVQ
jgi:hypothetical protein